MTVQELINKLVEQCGNRSPSRVNVYTYRLREEDDGCEYYNEEEPEVASCDIFPLPFHLIVR